VAAVAPATSARSADFIAAVSALHTVRVQTKTKFGIGLMVVGFGVFAAWQGWMRTRKLTPVDVPIALRAGETASESFRPNLDGLYLIEIVTQRTLPADILSCFNGVPENPAACEGAHSVIRADWALLHEGQEIRRGSSDQAQIAAPNSDPATVVRVIGQFPAEARREYQLQVAITGDGRAFQTSHPRLRVAISSLAETDFQSANVLVFSISFICVLFGVILLAISWHVHRA
jgi:hypothetical protein